MSEYRSDEETVEQIQRFWRENGISLVVTVVVAVGGVLGWRAWQDAQAAEIGAASASYSAWSEALLAGEDEAKAAADALREAHPESAYVSLIGFQEAQQAVLAGDLDAARRALIGVLEAELPAAFHDVARMRLARLELASDDPAAALARPDAIAGSNDLVAALELRGDANVALGDLGAARSAYDAAIDAAERTGSAGRPLLEMKRDDLAPMPVVAGASETL